MKLEQLLAIFSLTLYLLSFLASFGFLAYLLYMVFVLNLTEQAQILIGLLVANKLFEEFANAIIKTLKEAKQSRKKSDVKPLENEE